MIIPVPGGGAPPQYFTDVPPSDPYYPYIQALAQLGITTGTSATTFSPDAPLTRAQAAVFITRALALTPQYAGLVPLGVSLGM